VILAIIAIGLTNIVYTSAVCGIPSPLTEPLLIVGGLVTVLFVINENSGRLVAPGVNTNHGCSSWVRLACVTRRGQNLHL